MSLEIMEQVARLLESGRALSRNREFEKHSGPRGGQLLRLFRVYSSLLAELERSAKEQGPVVLARQTPAGLRLGIQDADMGYVHESLIPKALTGVFRTRLSELGVAVEGEKPSRMNYTDPEELLPVVDENDCQVGVAARRDIHQKGLLHRAVHVLLFDGRGRLYLQRRSKQKDTHPLKWTSSASGHADPGEGYLESAQRELKEELGLELTLYPLGGLKASNLTENEFVRVYLARSDQKPRPNPEEILEGRFFQPEEALDLAADPERACPSLGVVLELWQDAID